MFITLEGIDGSGKSTQIKYLETYFHNLNIPVLITREPGNTEIGKKIRELLLDKSNKLNKKTQFLLFMADRIEHAEQVIRPALKDNKIVICDRYIDSTHIYQGIINGIGKSTVSELHNQFIEKLIPDLTILIDVDADIARDRTLNKLGSDNDTFDSKPIGFYENVRQAYLEHQEIYSYRIKKINGNQSKFQVYGDIISLLREHGVISGFDEK